MKSREEKLIEGLDTIVEVIIDRDFNIRIGNLCRREAEKGETDRHSIDKYMVMEV